MDLNFLPHPPTCFVCLIKYLVLSFLIIIRQSKSKPLPSIEGNSKRRKYTNEIQNKHFRDITENMRTSFHPRQLRYHLALGTPNRKHIEEPEALPLPSISEDLAERCTSRNVIQKNCYKKLSAQWFIPSRNKKKVRKVHKQIVQ